MYLANNMVAQYLPIADYIIVLGEDGKVAEQGTWQDVQASAGYIRQVVLKDKNDDTQTSCESSEARDKVISRGSAAKKPDDKLQDLNRRTGDIALYSMKQDAATQAYKETLLKYLQAIISGPLAGPKSSCCWSR
jgi:hypothetical protein